MNAEEPSVILFPEQRCCWICGKPSARKCCSRSCRMILANYEEFTELRFILSMSRWAGAPSQEERLEEYLRNRMWEAVRRLGHDEKLLGEVLVEIIELVEEDDSDEQE